MPRQPTPPPPAQPTTPLTTPPTLLPKQPPVLLFCGGGRRLVAAYVFKFRDLLAGVISEIVPVPVLDVFDDLNISGMTPVGVQLIVFLFFFN